MTVTIDPTISTTDAPTDGSADHEAQRDALLERLFEALLGSVELLSVEVGIRLGLYGTLAEGGPATPTELAERAGIHERYAREWLEQQASAGIVDVADPSADAAVRTFSLLPGHAEALTDRESPGWAGSGGPAVVGLAAVLDHVVDAYRTGAGVDFADYGREIRDAIGGFNRPAFVNDLASWFASVPSVDDRLRAGRARVLDLGCGAGWSTIAIARAYPDVVVDGIDLDEASIADARRNAEATDVSDRLHFQVADGAHIERGPGYDVVCIFEALHDMADPVATLAAVRSVLVEGGCLLVADERVAEAFTTPGDIVERFNYGWSVLHCLPSTRAEDAQVDAGTVLRPDTVRDYGASAGFGAVEVLPVEHDFWRFYRLSA